MMMDSNHWSMAVTFWTLLAGVVVTALSIAIGNLMPALLAPAARDGLGLGGLGLFMAAHVAAVCVSLHRAGHRPVGPLAPAEYGI